MLSIRLGSREGEEHQKRSQDPDELLQLVWGFLRWKRQRRNPDERDKRSSGHGCSDGEGGTGCRPSFDERDERSSGDGCDDREVEGLSWDRERTQTNAQHSSGFTGREGALASVEVEPGPRQALVAHLEFLARRETAKEPRRALQALVWGWLR